MLWQRPTWDQKQRWIGNVRLGGTTGHQAQAFPEGLLLLLGLKAPSERANPGNAREIADLVGFDRESLPTRLLLRLTPPHLRSGEQLNSARA